MMAATLVMVVMLMLVVMGGTMISKIARSFFNKIQLNDILYKKCSLGS